MCLRSTGQARPIDGRLLTHVTVGWENLEVVPSFCYLGDCLSSGGGCELIIITRCHVGWGKFNEPILTSRSFPKTSRGRVYNSCVRSAMLHASETWAPTSSNLNHLQRNDRAMICWMWGIATKDHTHRIRWHSHVERSNGWLKKKVQKLNPTGSRGPGHSTKTWREVIDKDWV